MNQYHLEIDYLYCFSAALRTIIVMRRKANHHPLLITYTTMKPLFVASSKA